MAQFFYDFADGLLPASFAFTGSTLQEVITDSDAINGKALYYSRELGGGTKVLDFGDTAPAAESVEMYTRLRSGVGLTQFTLSKQSGIGARFHLKSSDSTVDLVGATSTVIASASLPADMTVYFNLRLHYDNSANRFKARAWTGTVDDEPADWAFNVVYTSRPFGTEQLKLSPLASAHAFDVLGLGTADDPAPTGPLDVSAEPFLLRHNPRTNKVIPVLTFPTVTDIGANCVRPRITKGF